MVPTAETLADVPGEEVPAADAPPEDRPATDASADDELALPFSFVVSTAESVADDGAVPPARAAGGFLAGATFDFDSVFLIGRPRL
jgi:hypothetical protein